MLQNKLPREVAESSSSSAFKRTVNNNTASVEDDFWYKWKDLEWMLLWVILLFKEGNFAASFHLISFCILLLNPIFGRDVSKLLSLPLINGVIYLLNLLIRQLETNERKSWSFCSMAWGRKHAV